MIIIMIIVTCCIIHLRYAFADNSLVTYRGLRIGEHGLDGMRLFSTNVTFPEDSGI